jgi:hypothetical protein
MHGFPDPQNSQASNRLASSNLGSHAKCAPPSMACGNLDGSLFGDIARQLTDSIQGTLPLPTTPSREEGLSPQPALCLPT